MNSIRGKIIDKINSGKGWISIEKFMKISMFDKNHGYYISKNPLGKNNDYITAPEISQLFGELLNRFKLKGG